MKTLLRHFLLILALIPSVKSEAQVHYVSYDNWNAMPKVFPQVIMFTADWCGPSEAMMPLIQRLALEYAGRAQFYFVDIDDNPEWAAEWSVPVLPSTYFVYSSDLSDGSYKWRGEKSQVPYYRLRDTLEWTLANWDLENLPAPSLNFDLIESDDPTPVMSAALGGDVTAMLALSETYSSEFGFMWNTMAAEKGNADAMYDIGKWYYQYDATLQKGINWIIKAAENGSLYACDFLIDAYHYGDMSGFSKDYEREQYYRNLKRWY